MVNTLTIVGYNIQHIVFYNNRLCRKRGDFERNNNASTIFFPQCLFLRISIEATQYIIAIDDKNIEKISEENLKVISTASK